MKYFTGENLNSGDHGLMARVVQRWHEFSGESITLGLVHHVAVPKNIQGYHGVGDDPTRELPDENSVLQAKHLGRVVLSVLAQAPYPQQSVHCVDMVSSPRPPCVATASLLKTIMEKDAGLYGFSADISLGVDRGLRGIGMGQMNGLTEAQMAAKDPEYVRQLGLWRMGQRRPDLPPEFPGDAAERLTDFGWRMRRAVHVALGRRRQEAQMLLVVASTSPLQYVRALLEQPPSRGDVVSGPDRVRYVDIPHGNLELWHLSKGVPVQITEGFMTPGMYEPTADFEPLQSWELATFDSTTSGSHPVPRVFND